MTLFTTVLAFLVTLGVLIVVHELGHFWAARHCGVRVLRFSIGFGKPLFRTVRGTDRTEWVVAAIPLGGYVRMLDERDEEFGPVPASDLPRAFNRQSVLRRIYIVLAGPAANLLLAIAVYWVLSMVGTMEPRAVLAAPPADSVAARTGVRAGDTAVAFNDSEIRSWNELRWHLLKAAVGRGEFELRVLDSRGISRDLMLSIRSDDVPEFDGDVIGRLGFALNVGPARIQRVAPDTAASRADLRAGDQILAIEGEPMNNAHDVRLRVMSKPGATLALDVLRDGRRQSLTVTAASVAAGDGRRIGQLGIEFVPIDVVEVNYGPIDSLGRAAARTWDMSIFSLRILGRMITGEASWKNLAGPVTIADYAGQTARLGVVAYLSFLALVSISLGVLNLLPIPMLDGGHLLYYLIEIVRGSPPAQWLVDWGQRAGIATLVMLTALALYNDLTRLFS